MKRSSRLPLAGSRTLVLTAVAAALAVGAASAFASRASAPPQGKMSGIADFGIASPQTSDWDRGGNLALMGAAKALGAKPTWLSNISFDQAPQVIDRLVQQKIPLIVSNGSGYANAMVQAAQKYPSTWFVVYSDLPSTNGLSNLVGIRLHWNQMAYLAGAMACIASNTKKVGLVISQPIPAYAHAVGGMMDGVKRFCGSSSDLLYTWTGTFTDVSKTKQAAQALIAKGADVVTDFQDAGTPGVIAAVKANPKVRYVGTMSDWTKAIPNQIIGSVYIDYDSGYMGFTNLLLKSQLKPKIYLSDAQTGGIQITKITHTTPAVARKIEAAFNAVKSGKLVVSYAHQVKQ
jgi:basic membrane lipoprotein Med (substrate-binding protein (PBP1-ABC) superfamily)